MDTKQRVKAYADQIGVSAVGGFKNSTATKKIVGKLTARQQRRLRKKNMGY